MHILLTDLLTCPRCGPAFGLLVLADEIVDRRVREGRLGCANCRESYPVRGGVADLRHSLVERLPPAAVASSPEADPAERAFRLAALLGVTTPNATVLLVEPRGDLAPAVSDVVPAVHVVGMAGEEQRHDPPGGAPGLEAGEGILSRVLGGARIPFRDRSLRGLAIAGPDPRPLLEEARRTLLPGGRLVVDPAPADAAEMLRESGFHLRLEQGRLVVVDAPKPG